MTAPSPGLPASLEPLLALPGVADAVEDARAACTRLRWHQALRRRIPEAATESRVRGAAASGLLEGAQPAGVSGAADLVRDLVRGSVPWEEVAGHPDGAVLVGAVRCTLATEQMGTVHLRAPAQVLATLHTAAATGLLPTAELGRPRVAAGVEGEWADLGPAPSPAEAAERLALVHEILLALSSRGAPVLLVSAVAHAELVAARPFARGNAVVARALERLLLRAGGLDPTGVAVPERGHAVQDGLDYRGALAAYASGDPEGVRLWLLHCATAVQRAAEEGERVADAVLAGRLNSR